MSKKKGTIFYDSASEVTPFLYPSGQGSQRAHPDSSRGDADLLSPLLCRYKGRSEKYYSPVLKSAQAYKQPSVHSSVIHNSHGVEAAQVSVDGRMDKEDVVYIKWNITRHSKEITSPQAAKASIY